MIVVAGHVALDIIPRLEHAVDWRPGSLYEVGPATLSIGGAVGNVAHVLSALGQPVRWLGPVGDDAFARVVREMLAERASLPADDPGQGVLITVPAAATSYTVVVSPPESDRVFLHHPGANDAFGGLELRSGLAELAAREPQLLDGAFLHVGYPPVMAAIYEDGGHAFAAALAWAREQGMTVSLDTAMPDPQGQAARVDWNAFLRHVLPNVDLFAPSWGDLAAMLPDLPETPDRDTLVRAANAFLAMGAGAVLFKLGQRGAYLRTAHGLRGSGHWSDRELLSPSFVVEAIGTTGAGDATIAGLLAAWQAGATPEHAATVATATGACSVEGVNAGSSVPTLAGLEARLAAGWPRISAAWFGSTDVDTSGIVRGPSDARGGNA